MDFSAPLRRHREFFDAHGTRPVEARRQQLEAFLQGLRTHEDVFLKALQADLGKSAFESYATEVGFLVAELKHTLKKLSSWTRPQRESTPILHWPASSWIYPEPKGVVLIIGPWNYPLQLALGPLIAALAAGNAAVVKASELAPHTAEAIRAFVKEVFPSEWVSTVEGGVEETQALLKERFDHVFFTGSTRVGRIVMKAAAENLVPVTLELGGKSPALICADAPLDVTARRIAWGKFVNAGQTCVAPDYVLVPRAKKEAFVEHFRAEVAGFTADARKSDDYARIVSRAHFDRLVNLMKGGRVLVGGRIDEAALKIEPTLLDLESLDHPLMQEELFGPLLPLIPYDDLEGALKIIKRNERPLAFYLFTGDDAVRERLLNSIPFGGGVVNDTLIHVANPHLPFGGIGPSGTGAYHGSFGFGAFSHFKAVMKRPFSLDVRLRYPPYAGRLKLIKKLLG